MRRKIVPFGRNRRGSVTIRTTGCRCIELERSWTTIRRSGLRDARVAVSWSACWHSLIVKLLKHLMYRNRLGAIEHGINIDTTTRCRIQQSFNLLGQWVVATPYRYGVVERCLRSNSSTCTASLLMPVHTKNNTSRNMTTAQILAQTLAAKVGLAPL